MGSGERRWPFAGVFGAVRARLGGALPARARRVPRGGGPPPPSRVAAVAAAVGLVVSGGAVAAAGPWDAGQRTAERAAAHGAVRGRTPAPARWRPAGAVLRAVDATAAGPAGAVPSATGLGRALRPLLDDPAAGTLGVAVTDAATGRLLFGSRQDVPSTPASTTKLATTVAALELLGPDHRITTRVVRTGPGGIVLVGGGDPTLTAVPAAGPDGARVPAYAPGDGVPGDLSDEGTPGDSATGDGVTGDGVPETAAGRDGARAAAAGDAPASLDVLAARTARALRLTGTRAVRLGYDTSLYTGPAVHPIGPNPNIATVTALMADEGRVDPHSTENAARRPDPARAAAAAFARSLGRHGVRVLGAPAPATAPPRAATLARVQSPPLARLVERALTLSDNDLAEAIARQAALAAHRPASFAGSAAAVRAALARLGVPLGGTVLDDGSGLDRRNGIPPRVLTRLLALAASPDHPELRPVLTGLPVAGFTGTLQDRYGGSGAAAAAGLVRAKTGTLTGVNTLAGLAVDRDGRLLAFALMSRGAAGPQAARALLDRIAARIAACGCRWPG